MNQNYFSKLIYLGIALGSILLYESLGKLLLGGLSRLVFSSQIGFLDISQSYFAFSDTLVSIIFILIYLVIWLWLVRDSKRKSMELTPFKKIIYAILIPLGIGGMTVLWSLLADNLATIIPILDSSQENLDAAYAPVNQAHYLWTFLSIAVAGPMMEDLLFRGIVFKSLERIYAKPWFPILISGMMFGIWHGNAFQAVYTMLMGIILAYVYYYMRDMLLVMVIHIINNALSTLPPSWGESDINLYINLLGVLLIIPMIFLLYRLYKSSKMTLPQESIEGLAE